MATHVKNLGRQILGCPAEGVGLVAGLQELGQTEVSKRDVTIVVHEYVLRLKVAMDDIAIVQISKRQNDLSTNKLNCWLLEAANFVDVVVNVAAWEVFQEEVDLELVLEYEVHRVYKRMVRLE